MFKRFHFFLFVSLTALFWVFNAPAPAQNKGLPDEVWKNKTFTRFTYEEDVKDTLRAIAQLIDMPITFGDGITDAVTMEFKDMPLKDAFDFLIDQYNLEYSADALSIHVYKPGVGGIQDVLITLENLEVQEVKDAIERFGLMKKEVKMIFDPPLRTVYLTGPPRAVGNIQRLIKTLESAKKGRVAVRPEIRYFPLRYAKVSDVKLTIGTTDVTVKGLTTVLTEILGLTRQGEVTGGGRARLVNGRIVEEAPPSLKDQPGSREGQAMIIKRIISAEAGTITSDPRTNRVIIRDYPEKLDEYAEIIKQLDKPMKMIKIDVTIVEASKDFAKEFGVGYAGLSASSRKNYFLPATSGTARESLGELAEPVTLGTENTPTTATADLGQSALFPLLESAAGTAIASQGLAGTFFYFGASDILAITLQAAETKGISKTINKSSIITMDNMQAIVESKISVTYKLQSGGDNPTVEDQTVDAGIKLTVTPHIIEEKDGKNLVELVIVAERSSFLATRTDDIPEKATTDLTTQAVIRDEGTLVVGGLFDQSYAMGETGIPCLMGLPGLGPLFKTQSARNPKSNILFFMTPKVISLDQIPHESTELQNKIERSEKELHLIDQDRQEKWIEKNRE
ncbi:MAG: secretin N-terminal domain-containing protein [Pseudomonadota bacterium]